MCGVENFFSMCSVTTYRSEHMRLLDGQMILTASAASSMLWSLFKLIDGILGILGRDKCAFFNICSDDFSCGIVFSTLGCLATLVCAGLSIFFTHRYYRFADLMYYNIPHDGNSDTHGAINYFGAINYSTQSCIDHPKCKESMQASRGIGYVVAHYYMVLQVLSIILLLLAIAEATANGMENRQILQVGQVRLARESCHLIKFFTV